MSVEYSEKKGDGGDTVTYVRSKKGWMIQEDGEKKPGRINGTCRSQLSKIFLPEGYPKTVSEDYLSYQIWDTVQAFASSISGSLATQVFYFERAVLVRF